MTDNTNNMNETRYWRLNYTDVNGDNLARFMIFDEQETWAKFLRRVSIKLARPLQQVAPFKYTVRKGSFHSNVIVNDQEDYSVLVENMKQSESSLQSCRGFGLIVNHST